MNYLKASVCISLCWMTVGSAIAGDVITVREVVVDFAATVDVPARQSGSVGKIEVRQNQWIEAGTAVARLDDSAIVIRRRAAMLRYESAQLILQDDVEIRYAKMALAEAEDELEDSRNASERMSGAVARNQLRRTQLGVERAQLEVARSEKQRRQAEIDAQLRAADLAVIDHDLERCRCVTPISGVVLNVHRQNGEWVNAGDSLATIADAAVLHLRALIDADSLDPARCIGLPITAVWDSKSSDPSRRPEPNMLAGKIISVDPNRLPGNRFRVHAEVVNRRVDAAGESWLLVPGMDVRMQIDHADAGVAWRRDPRPSGSLR